MRSRERMMTSPPKLLMLTRIGKRSTTRNTPTPNKILIDWRSSMRTSSQLRPSTMGLLRPIHWLSLNLWTSPPQNSKKPTWDSRLNKELLVTTLSLLAPWQTQLTGETWASWTPLRTKGNVVPAGRSQLSGHLSQLMLSKPAQFPTSLSSNW